VRPLKIDFNSLNVTSIKIPYFYLSPSFDLEFSNLLGPGLFVMFKSVDKTLQDQITNIMMYYRSGLNTIKRAYSELGYKTAKHYENSIKKNEDGFFIRLYHIIYDT
jgi:hypothetical protein